MKKVFSILCSFLLIGTLSGCQSSDSTAISNDNSNTNTTVSSDCKTLIVYFSLPETTNPNDMNQEEENSTIIVNGEVLGNTQYVATLLKDKTKGDIFRIEPAVAYPLEHSVLVDQAKEEQVQQVRPAIQNKVENFDQYDTIFIGYPNWWGDMPMILYSFFDTYDFTGKTIVPFNTHGGSGLSNTVKTIQELEPNATIIENALSISRDVVDKAEQEVNTWLQELGL